jgi:hypothetical protein
MSNPVVFDPISRLLVEQAAPNPLEMLPNSLVLTNGEGVLIPEVTNYAESIIASEALTEGNWIHVYAEGLERRVRKASANAATPYRANGFAAKSCVAGESVLIYFSGVNRAVSTALAGLTISDLGSPLYLNPSIPGEAQLIIPSGEDEIPQLLGYILDVKTPYSTVSCKLSDKTQGPADLGLGNVENTAISTWEGSQNITTLGTITTGVWEGEAIPASSIAVEPNPEAYPNATNVADALQALAETSVLDGPIVNVGTVTASVVNMGTAPSTQTVNIGTGAGVTSINIGGPGDTVTIAGDWNYIHATNLQITDKTIIVNKGGLGLSGFGSGVDVEEGGYIVGTASVSSNRASWTFKAPATLGTISLTPSPTTFFTALVSTATANRVLNLPDTTGTLLVNPMTAQGDLLIGGVGGSASKLAIGPAGTIPTSDGTTISWQVPSGSGSGGVGGFSNEYYTTFTNITTPSKLTNNNTMGIGISNISRFSGIISDIKIYAEGGTPQKICIYTTTGALLVSKTVTVSAGDGWKTVTLDTPFIFNPNSKIIITRHYAGSRYEASCALYGNRFNDFISFDPGVVIGTGDSFPTGYYAGITPLIEPVVILSFS